MAAAGVHLIDTVLREGRPMGPLALPELPTIPGREVAGVVDAVGPRVDEQWLGRRVVAHLGPASGGYAELAVRETEALHALPDGLADDAAVAMIGTGRTALAVLEVAQLTAEDVVLVTAAAGGLGSLLVQAARNAGATVVGVAGGPAKVRARQVSSGPASPSTTPRRAGATPCATALDGREVTVALDGVGGALGRGALELLGVGGRLILFGLVLRRADRALDRRPLLARADRVGGDRRADRAAPGRRARPRGAALAAAAGGRLVPLVQRFALAQAAAAHTAIETRATVGKTVLVP